MKNKKAQLGFGITDIISYLLFGLILLLFFLIFVFIAKKPITIQAEYYEKNFEAEQALLNYIEAPIYYDTNNDGNAELITLGEFSARAPPAKREVWEEKTREFFQDYAKTNFNKPWRLRIFNPDKTIKFAAQDTEGTSNPYPGKIAKAYLPSKAGMLEVEFTFMQEFEYTTEHITAG